MTSTEAALRYKTKPNLTGCIPLVLQVPTYAPAIRGVVKLSSNRLRPRFPRGRPQSDSRAEVDPCVFLKSMHP